MPEENDTGAVRVSMRDIYIEVQRQGRLLEKIANSLPDSESKIDDQNRGSVNWRCGWVGLWAGSVWLRQ